MFLHEILDGIEWISQISGRCNGKLFLYPWQLILHIPVVLIHQECVFQIVSPNSGRLREGLVSENHQKILSRGCFIYLYKKLTFFFKYQYSEAVSVNLDFVITDLLFLNFFGSSLKFFVHKMFRFLEHMGGILNILNFFFVIANVLFQELDRIQQILLFYIKQMTKISIFDEGHVLDVIIKFEYLMLFE